MVGLNPSNPLLSSVRSKGCGSCLEVQCTGSQCHTGVGSLQAMITDECASGCDSTQVRFTGPWQMRGCMGSLSTARMHASADAWTIQLSAGSMLLVHEATS